MLKLKKQKKGITIIETLIASAVTMTLLGFVTSFLWSFNKYTSSNIEKSIVGQDLQTLQRRLEKEILPARMVLAAYDKNGISKVTDKDTLILSLPVFEKDPDTGANTYWPATLEPKNTAKNDVLIIDFIATDSKSGRLSLTLIPAPDLDSGTYFKRPALKNQVIHNYIEKTFFDTTDNSSKPYDIFSFYDSKGNHITSEALYNEISSVKVTVWATSTRTNPEKREVEIALRNFNDKEL